MTTTFLSNLFNLMSPVPRALRVSIPDLVSCQKEGIEKQNVPKPDWWTIWLVKNYCFDW